MTLTLILQPIIIILAAVRVILHLNNDIEGNIKVMLVGTDLIIIALGVALIIMEFAK